MAATRRYGVGSGASRLVTGNHPLYAALEARLAAAKGTADALVFGAGYLANSGIIPALIGGADVIFVDELAHACIWAGAKLSAARTVVFRHNDMAHLARIAGGASSRPWPGDDRHGLRVFHGWRSGAGGGTGRSGGDA